MADPPDAVAPAAAFVVSALFAEPLLEPQLASVATTAAESTAYGIRDITRDIGGRSPEDTRGAAALDPTQVTR